MATQRNSNRFSARSTRSQTLPGSTTGVCRNSSAGDLFIEDVHRMIAFFVSLRLRTKCVLFFGDGLLSDVDALTIVLAALGAICVASAVLLILELSDPYSGLFRMPHEGFDAIIRVLTKGAEMLASPTPSAPTPSPPALWRR